MCAWWFQRTLACPTCNRTLGRDVTEGDWWMTLVYILPNFNPTFSPVEFNIGACTFRADENIKEVSTLLFCLLRKAYDYDMTAAGRRH